MGKYMVKNIWSDVIASSHRNVKNAILTARRMIGIGWFVFDTDGNEWDFDFDGRPVIYQYPDNDGVTQ